MSVSPKPSTIIGGVATLVVAYICSVMVPISNKLTLLPTSIPAVGQTSARLFWSKQNLFESAVPFFLGSMNVSLVKGADLVRVVGPTQAKGPAQVEIALQALGKTGTVVLELSDLLGHNRLQLSIFSANEQDSDQDGFPDKVELLDNRDRNAFRAWFTDIAQSQFYVTDSRWQPIHRDCAGLLRFSFKQALRQHDNRWLSKTPYLHHAPAPDVRRYRYPLVPVLGEKVFRTCSGQFRMDDLNRCFSDNASARVLMEHNTVFISKKIERAQAGDLLFFRNPEHYDAPMHSMILVDEANRGQQARVVYHTGFDEHGPGEVRLVSIADLDQHRDESWHIRPDNPKFLGFYRWRILEGGRP